MKHETLYIMVRVLVQADHVHISDIVNEVEKYSRLDMSDTANVNILETEILMSRVHNPIVNKRKSEPANLDKLP